MKETESRKSSFVKCATVIGAFVVNKSGFIPPPNVFREQSDCRKRALVNLKDKNGTLIPSRRYGEFMAGNCPQGRSALDDFWLLRYAVIQRKENSLPPLEIHHVFDYWGKKGTEPEKSSILAVGSAFNYFDLDMPSGDDRMDNIA